MAVITTAIAVGAAAAISAGAVAAGVSVGVIAATAAVIATAGVAMTVVGAVTGNKDLSLVGEIMTGVGAGAGLGGLAAGALGLGANAAASGAAAAAPAAEAATPAATSVINPSVSASVTQSLAQAGKVGAGTVLAPATAQSGVGVGTVLAPTASGAAAGGSSSLASALPLATQGGQTAAKLMAGAPPPPTPPPAPTVQTPTGPSAPSMITPTVSVDPGVSIAGAANNNPGFWSSLDPSVKAMMMMGGTQMLGQGAAGMFAGASQSEQNDLLARRIGIEQQVADQQEAQREFLREGGRYAPRITFNRPKGMIAHQFPSFPA